MKPYQGLQIVEAVSTGQSMDVTISDNRLTQESLCVGNPVVSSIRRDTSRATVQFSVGLTSRQSHAQQVSVGDWLLLVHVLLALLIIWPSIGQLKQTRLSSHLHSKHTHRPVYTVHVCIALSHATADTKQTYWIHNCASYPNIGITRDTSRATCH